MLTIDPKKLKSFCEEIESAWWIENPIFRRKYNFYVSAALVRGYETGDFIPITKILKSTPDENIKSNITRNLFKFLPLSYREKTESIIKDKTRWQKFELKDFSDFKAIEVHDFMEEKDGNILINKIKLEPDEFVDFMLDTITLNRNHFCINDLEKITETLILIKDRLEKELAAKRA